MGNQYTKASDVKKYIEKKIFEQVSKEELDNFHFDIINSKDRENQDFLYISLIDKGNFVEGLNTQLLQKIGLIIKSTIEKNCPNLMEIVGTENGAGKQLLWLPKDTQCFTLYEQYEDIDQFSLRVPSKLKIR